jgi:hypothetical protein
MRKTSLPKPRPMAARGRRPAMLLATNALRAPRYYFPWEAWLKSISAIGVCGQVIEFENKNQSFCC